MPAKATVPIRNLKVTVPLPAGAIPPDLVPPIPEPAGEPVLELIGEGGLVVLAKLNGKSVRKALKTLSEVGVENAVVILQGSLRSPDAPGRPFLLESAGLTVSVKKEAP
jgi:hypothetical protein